MPSHRNTATTGARSGQPPGTIRPQTDPDPGPAGDPDPQTQTPPDTSTRGHRPAAPTQADPEPHSHHNPPVRQKASPAHTSSDGPSTPTRTPTDATSARPERPLGTMHPRALIPTGSPSPQAPAAPCTSTPGYHPPAPAQTEPAPSQRQDPPAGPAVRPTKAPSGSPPAPSPDPDPDQPHATVPGHGLPTGVPHPEGGTPAPRPAAAEGSGSTRALAGHMGSQPRPAPVPDGQTRAVTPIQDDAAAPPAPPAQPQREEPTMDEGAGATEDAEGRPQRKETPMPTAVPSARGPTRAEIPSGVTGKPGDQHASTPANRPPDMAASETSEAPDTEPGAPTPGTGHAADPPPPPAHEAQTAGPAGTAPSTAPAHRSDTGAPGDATSGEARTQGLPQAHAELNARATTPGTPQRATDRGPFPGGHTRDEDSFDAFMESCRGTPQTDLAPTAPRSHPEPRGNHTEPGPGPPREPLAVSRQAHPQRDYATVGARTANTAATDDGHVTASGAADRTPDEPPRHSPQGSGTRVETGTNTASKPAEQPPWATAAWGRGHLD